MQAANVYDHHKCGKQVHYEKPCVVTLAAKLAQPLGMSCDGSRGRERGSSQNTFLWIVRSPLLDEDFEQLSVYAAARVSIVCVS